MIIPRLLQDTAAAERSRLPFSLTVFAGEDTEKACALLPLLLPQCTASPAEKAGIRAEKTSRFETNPEGYALTVRNGAVTVEYSDYAGLRNALSTFALKAKAAETGLEISDGVWEDSPACAHRGIMLDPARGNPPFEDFCNMLILAAKCKMNVVHIHLAEDVGLSVEMDCLPVEYRHKNCYTKEQVRQLNGLCEILGLEIIPEFDMPAHAQKLIELNPDLACTPPEDVAPSHWAICTGTEETYALYEKIISEVLTLFPKGRYFHMGGDELEFADLSHKRPHSLCHWTICSKCKEFRTKHGLKDRTEQYYYFANRINEIVKKHGRQMMMWSDQMDCTRPACLSQDILMQFWRVAWPGRGPYDGCSFDGQLDLGYTLVNSFYPETYTDEEPYINDEKIRTWRWDERPRCKEEHKNRVIGSELCAWNYGDPLPKYEFHDRVLPVTIALMGDKLWNGDVLPYGEEYDQALTRTVLGAETPEELNIFRGIGAKIPPRTAARSYPDRVTCTEEELKELEAQLSRTDCYRRGDAFRAGVYAKCIRYTIENRKAKDQ